MNKIENLRTRLGQLSETMASIAAAAEAESRVMNETETASFEQADQEFKATESEIARLERLEEIKARSTVLVPRAAQPMPGAQSGTAAPVAGATTITGGAPVAHNYANHGFTKGVGEFFLKVRDSKVTGRVDPRLMVNAITTFGGEAVGADGGYLLPPQFAQELWSAVTPQDSFVNALNPVQTNSNLLVVPSDEDPPWGTSGVTAAKTAEGGAITASKPVIRKVNVVMYAIKSLVHVSEESLSDIPFLASYVQAKMAEKLRWKIENYAVNGTGADQPLGILNAPALLSYADKASTASAYAAVDIYGMQAAALPGAGGFWLASPTVIPALASIATGSTGYPLMNPDLSAPTKRTLAGDPIYVSEACKALDTLGDLFYVKPSGYVLAFNGGVKTASTAAFSFDQDLQSFKATVRMGGQPTLSGVVTRGNGTSTASNLIAMAGSRS